MPVLALILVGLGLMVDRAGHAELWRIGVGGVVAFIAGSIILIDTDVEGFAVSMPLVLTVAVIAGPCSFPPSCSPCASAPGPS